MKTIMALTALVACLVVGCSTSQRRVTYNTLYTVQVTTTAAYNGYLDGVVKGTIRTNDVPLISKDYRNFQAGFVAAVELATINSPSTPEVNNLSATLLAEIAKAKEAK